MTGAAWMTIGLVAFQFTKEAYFPIIAGLALLGLFQAWVVRRPLLPAWLAVLWVLDPRGGHNYITVPLALLAGVGVAEVVVPIWQRVRASESVEDGRGSRAIATPAGLLPTGLLCVLVAYGMVSAMSTAPVSLGVVPVDERGAMAWVAANTAPDSRFVVVNGIGWDISRGTGMGMDAASGWGLDRSSEWFPVLAERPSIATPQGDEWLPDVQHAERRYYELQKCAVRDATCLDEWSGTYGTAFTHVFIPKETAEPGSPRDPEGCCWALRHRLRGDPSYRVVYDGPGATIFERRATDSVADSRSSNPHG
jgi:hypothetical protein